MNFPTTSSDSNTSGRNLDREMVAASTEEQPRRRRRSAALSGRKRSPAATQVGSDRDDRSVAKDSSVGGRAQIAKAVAREMRGCRAVAPSPGAISSDEVFLLSGQAAVWRQCCCSFAATASVTVGGADAPRFGCRSAVVRPDDAGDRCRILADRQSGRGPRRIVPLCSETAASSWARLSRGL